MKGNKELETNDTKKELIFGIVIGLLLIIIVMGAFVIPFIKNSDSGKDNDQTEEVVEKKFTDEYPEVGEDNVFSIKTIDEIIKVLEHGTGLVYLGFPECPWCKEYVIHLNDVAKEENVGSIYYCNILNDRKNNSSEYQKIVSLIGEYLQYDEEGNKKIYVPAVIAVNEGKIVGFDDETSWDTKGYSDPKDYWTEAELKDLKNKLRQMIKDSTPKVCTDCNK